MNSESFSTEDLVSSEDSVSTEALASMDDLVSTEGHVPSAIPTPLVNYDSEPVLELELDGVDYRLDPGKQGTALCVSMKASGSWDWAFVGEAKWDATSLRCKELQRSVRESLGKALRELAES